MISVTQLSKSFGDFNAVDNLSFDIKAGDIVGFLGPNGAGKSTTMKMLTGFLSPSAGEIRIFDQPIDEALQNIQRQLGYLPEGAPAYGDMHVLEFLDFIADIRGLSGAQKKLRLTEVIRQVELDNVLHKPIEQLSKGFKRRVGLAQAIIHDPAILILDEPTDGLDPNQKHQVRQLIQTLSKDKIVIISTHILEEVTALCNRAMIIAEGKMLFDSTPAELQQRSRYFQAITLGFEQWPDPEGFSQIPGVDSVELNPALGQVTLFPKGKTNLTQAVNDFLAEHHLQASHMMIEQGRLDDVFREMTAGGDA